MSKFWVTKPVSHDRDGTARGIIDNEAAAEEDHKSGVVTLIPPQLEWATIDMKDPLQLEEVAKFLQKHYLDLNSQMQVYFTTDFLKWFYYRPSDAFDTPPTWTPSTWAVGLRSATGKKQLVGFHGAMPIHVRYGDVEMDVATSNFLCVHSKMRDKGLAPMLIKELSRVLGKFRVGGVFSIAFPGPASCVPFCTLPSLYRPINLSTLESAGVWAPKSKASRKSLNRLYAKPTSTRPFRRMENDDVSSCMGLMETDSKKYKVAPLFRTEQEFVHHFCTMAESFVIIDDGKVVDFFSYLPMRIKNGSHHITIAQILYITTLQTPIAESGKALVASTDADVVNSYGHFGIPGVASELKFEYGDLRLNYYNYNYGCPLVSPQEISMVIV